MPTLTCSRLFRFLLSLVIRLRLSVGRIASTFRARFASFSSWRSILTFARGRGQSQIRLHANDVPVVDNNPVEERPQISERANAEGEDSGTLAVPPVGLVTRWEDRLSAQAHTSSHQFIFNPQPATPLTGSQRYNRRIVVQGDDISHVPAGQQKLLSALAPLPEGWRRHVHPEGNVIFYHEGLRIFTESDIIRHPNICQEILFCATQLIRKAIQIDDVIMDELTEIVLNVDDEEQWYYYFVDHKNRLLFWVDSVDLHQDIGTGLQGITAYSHIRYIVEARYWTHCEYYPHNRTLPEGVIEDLRGMLNYAKIEVFTSDSSTSPFTKDELGSFLDAVNSLKADRKISDPYSIWIIARLTAFLTVGQFMNFSGQPCARLNADTPLFGQQIWNRSILFKVVNVFLLGSPNEHADRLQRVWVDNTIILPRWKGFIDRLTTESGRYPIFSTVMLAVNISFLAVPGVLTPDSPAIQIIIYCSVVSSIASIVFSFAMSNVYSDPGLADAEIAADFMAKLSRGNWGMACLAITHSLPIACLVWSITLFSAALAIQIFGPKELATVIILGIECFILVFFGVMSNFVIRLFTRNDDVEDVDTSADNNPPPKCQEHVV